MVPTRAFVEIVGFRLLYANPKIPFTFHLQQSASLFSSNFPECDDGYCKNNAKCHINARNFSLCTCVGKYTGNRCNFITLDYHASSRTESSTAKGIGPSFTKKKFDYKCCFWLFMMIHHQLAGSLVWSSQSSLSAPSLRSLF